MTDKATKVLQTAIAELGTKENPPDSNKQKYGEWYGLNGYPWCAMFASWVFDQAGIPLGHIDDDKGYRYCPSALAHWKAAGRITSNPQPGDLVLFDWNKDGKPDHTGIYLQDNQDGLTFTSIEGNTSPGNASNGGQVMIMKRNKSVAIFVHPEIYDEA